MVQGLRALLKVTLMKVISVTKKIDRILACFLLAGLSVYSSILICFFIFSLGNRGWRTCKGVGIFLAYPIPEKSIGVMNLRM